MPIITNLPILTTIQRIEFYLLKKWYKVEIKITIKYTNSDTRKIFKNIAHIILRLTFITSLYWF